MIASGCISYIFIDIALLTCLLLMRRETACRTRSRPHRKTSAEVFRTLDEANMAGLGARAGDNTIPARTCQRSLVVAQVCSTLLDSGAGAWRYFGLSTIRI